MAGATWVAGQPQTPLEPSTVVLVRAEKCDDTHNRCIARKYWKGDDARMLEVFECESNFNERDENGCCIGIAQLYWKYHADRAARVGRARDHGHGEPYTRDDMYDPGKNVAVAWDLFTSEGWGPWDCA